MNTTKLNEYMKVIEYNPHLLSNSEIPLYKIKNKYVLY